VSIVDAGRTGEKTKGERPHRIGAANRNRSAASGTSGGRLWPFDIEKQNRKTLKAEQTGSAFFILSHRRAAEKAEKAVRSTKA
jgi:hypothetical protein